MSRRSKKIFVNMLSISRIIGALLMPLVFANFSMLKIVLIISLLFITDTFDGLLARKWKVQTRGGALLDPLGDKLLAASCIFSFIFKDTRLLITLLLEIAIAYVNINRGLHGEEANTIFMGKIKTTALFIMLGLCAAYSLKPDALNILFNTSIDLTITKSVVNIAFLITLICQVLTIIMYINESSKQKNVRINRIPKLKSMKEIIKRLFDEDSYLEDRDKALIDIIKK